MRHERAQRPPPPALPRTERRWTHPSYWVTVNGVQYLAPLVLMCGDPRHPARDACEVWELELMRKRREKGGRR